MTRSNMITLLVLTATVLLCADALAQQNPGSASKVVIQPGSPGFNKWLFEGRLVLIPNAADVRRDRQAAEMGDASAQFRMALRYDEGIGVPQDYAESVRWLRKAAEQELPEAQYNLGDMYFNGLGVPEDFARAVAWFHKAALQGHTSAQKNLGAMYGRGQGVAQSNSQAYVWSSIAFMSGNETAASNRDVAASQLSAEELNTAQARADLLYREIQQ